MYCEIKGNWKRPPLACWSSSINLHNIDNSYIVSSICLDKCRWYVLRTRNNDNKKAIFQTKFRINFLDINFWISNKMSLKYIPHRLAWIDNMWAFVKIMVWRLTCAKPLPEPVFTKVADHFVSLGHNELNMNGEKYQMPFKKLSVHKICYSLKQWT